MTGNNVQSRIEIDVRTTGAEAATRALDKLTQSEAGLVSATEKTTKVRERSEAALDRLAQKYDAEFKMAQALSRELATLERARAAGLGNTEAFARASAGLTKAMNDNAKAAGLARHEWVNLGRQFTDVATSIAGGMSPFMVLTQQGGQIADAFTSSKGGAGAALRDFGATVLRYTLNPITLAVGAMGTAAYATYEWQKATDALVVSLNGLGRSSGLTVSGANSIAERAAASAGISASSARGLAGQYLSAGVPRSALSGAIGATQDFSRRLGLPFDDAASTLAGALADPARGAEELAKKFGIVSFAEREQIKQLQALGDRSGASAKLIGILTSRLAEMEDPTSRLTKLWDRLSNGFSDSLDAWGKLLSDGPAAYFSGAGDAARKAEQERKAAERERQARTDEAAARNQELDRLRESGALAVREIQARTFAEREAIALEKAYNETLRSTSDAVKAGIAVENERNRLLAEAARKAEDYARAGRDQLKLAGLSPYERGRQQLINEARDLREQTTPYAAAGVAVTHFADVVTQAAAKIGGAGPLVTHEGGKRIIGISRPAGSHAPYSDIIAAEGTGRYGDPYNTSLNFVHSPKPLTSMTMAESLAWGDQLRRSQGMNSSAKGAFQIVNRTQKDAMRALGLGATDPFSEANQQAMADWIFQTQGLGAWEGFKRKGAPSGVNDNGSGAIGRSIDKGLADQLKAYDIEKIKGPLKEANAELERQRELLKLQAEAYGQSAGEIARAAEQQRLVNEYTRQGVTESTIGSEAYKALTKDIQDYAKSYGDLADEKERAAKVNEAKDFTRDLAKGGISDVLTGLKDGKSIGKSIGKSLQAALQNMQAKAQSKAIDMISDQLSKQLSDLSSSFFSSLFSGGGGFLKGILPFEAGGVMTSSGPIPLRRYAAGGVASSPQLAMFGEGSRPEAYVPLPDGRSIPVALKAAQNVGQPGNSNMPAPKITINNNAPGVTVTPQRMSDGEIIMTVSSMISENNQALPGMLEDQRRRAAR